MGVTFNVIIIIAHATTVIAVYIALRKTKLEINIDIAIDEFGRTNPRRPKIAKILQDQFIILFVYYTIIVEV